MFDKNYKGRYILIEPTDFCNCDCIMCSRALLNIENPHNVPKGFMDFEVFKKIIDDIEIGNEHLAIKLFWIGESMLHKDFKKMLLYASEKIKGTKAYIDLHTNAQLMNEELREVILSMGNTLPRITFSIDATSSETYSKVRRNLYFEKVISNIRELLLEREKRHLLFPRFIFQFIVMDENKHEAKEFVSYWSNFIKENVNVKLIDVWDQLSEERKIEILKEKGLYEEFNSYE